MTTARQPFKSACVEALASKGIARRAGRGGINRLHCSKKFARKSGSSKPLPAVVAWQYFFSLLLAIAAVASVVPAYRECPPIQRLLHADRLCPAPEIAVVPIKSAFLALCSVP